MLVQLDQRLGGSSPSGAECQQTTALALTTTKTNMPKKLKQHLLKLLGVTAGYFAIMDGFAQAHLLMSLVTQSDNYEKIGYVASAIYLAIFVWFCWRFYTGVYRGGDFGD